MKRNLTFCALIFGFLLPLESAEPLALPDGKAGLPIPEKTTKSETIKPTMEGDSISAGTKNLRIHNNFYLTLTEGGREIAKTEYIFCVTDKKTKKEYWFGLADKNTGTFMLESSGNKRILKQKITLGEYTWDFMRHELELLPDGRIRIEMTWNDPDPEKASVKHFGYAWNLPYAAAGNSEILCDGKTHKLSSVPENKFLFSELAKKPHSLEFYADDPAKSILITGTPDSFTGPNSFSLKRFFQTFLIGNLSERKLVFHIDLSKAVKKKLTATFGAGSTCVSRTTSPCPTIPAGIF